MRSSTSSSRLLAYCSMRDSKLSRMLLLFSLGRAGRRDGGADCGHSGGGVQGQRGGGKLAHPWDWGVKPEASGVLASSFSPSERSEEGQDAEGTRVDGEPREGAQGQCCIWRPRATGAGR